MLPTPSCVQDADFLGGLAGVQHQMQRLLRSYLMLPWLLLAEKLPSFSNLTRFEKVFLPQEESALAFCPLPQIYQCTYTCIWTLYVALH